MEPLSRRNVLSAAAFGVTFLAGARRAEATPAGPKSLLVVWLEGGPSQLETWDPHPGSAIGGHVQALPTSVAGLSIANLYPQVAEQMRHLSVIRSLVSKEGDHERGTYAVKTGYRPQAGVIHPSLGALATYLTPPKGLDIPGHVSLLKSQWPARGGFLGAAFDAFKVANPGQHIDNLEPMVRDEARQQRRLESLSALSAAFGKAHPGVDPSLRYQATLDSALAMMHSDQLKAFRLDDEPQSVSRAYGDSSFGRGCIIARRLLERGVRAVEITLSGFDSHTANHEAHRDRAATLDPALATLVKELVERDLFESTVMVCGGEFGRTPRINAVQGRDHWPHGFSCLLGGGGLRSGIVIGETDSSGEKKSPADPIAVEDLSATLLTALGHQVSRDLDSAEGRPIPLSRGQPMRRLL